ncbi:MAG: hypothetical protein IPO92_04755 [Saprospiraceae bacterium]|nr:hypothetical protein [Saprospiraceae bacterium]
MKKLLVRKIWYTLKVLFFVLSMHHFSFAASYTCNCVANSNVNWSDPSSWQPNGVPGIGDDVLINCPQSTFVSTSGDITVKSLTITKLGYIFGPGVMTVTERLDTKFPLFWQMKLVIGPNATGLMTNDFVNEDSSQIVFYTDLVVNGSLILKSNGFSAYTVTVNGTLTQKEGAIRANVVVNTTGTLNLDSPVYAMDLHTLSNKGIVNWKNGQLSVGSGGFDNEGTFNIDALDQTFSYGGFFSGYEFINSGVINISPTINSINLNVNLINSGFINLNGPTKLKLGGINHSGSIIAPVGSSLELSGFTSGTGNEFNSGSLVNVSSLKTMDPTILKISQGADLSNIGNFNLGRGSILLDVALPHAATYVLSANIQTNINQTFVGNFNLEGGSIDGDVTIQFNTPNFVIGSGYFGGSTKVRFSSTTIADVKNLGISDLVNDGIINFREFGGFSIGIPGLTNIGTINTEGDALALYGYSNNSEISLFKNLGILNYNTKKAQFSIRLENVGTINMGINDTLAISGELIQKE